MKQFLAVLAAALLVTGIYVVTAGAGQQGVSPKRVAKLEKKVNKLQKTVKKIQKQQRMDEVAIVAALVYGGCNTAVTADAFQKTWTTIGAPFGSQTPLDDFGLCNALNIARQKVGAPPPVPTVSVFGALLDLFKPGSAAASLHAFDLAHARNLAHQVGIPLR